MRRSLVIESEIDVPIVPSCMIFYSAWGKTERINEVHGEQTIPIIYLFLLTSYFDIMQLAFILALSFVGFFSPGALSSPLEERQASQCIFNLGTSAVRYLAHIRFSSRLTTVYSHIIYRQLHR